MKEITVWIPKEAEGQRLIDYLNREGHAHEAPCGGKGTCKKCRVKVLEGNFRALSFFEEILVPDSEGYILACRALCPPEGAKILMYEQEGEGLVALAQEGEKTLLTSHEALGIALDIGTTTLAAALVDRTSGTVITTASALNPQSGFGADVMSRISAAKEGHLSSMQALLLKSVRQLCETLLAGFPDDAVSCMTVAGNPTMLHIFCGVSPEGMGQYPFTPAFLDAVTLKGETLFLPCETVTVLPSASAFVGSDVMGGVLTAHMMANDKPTLLLDIGTNGEMVLCTGREKGNRLFVTSAAAGPALEGANISCGMGGVAGAVSRVSLAYGENGDSSYEEPSLIYSTVGDLAPRGICGSGLVDLAACLLESGILDETGYLEEEFRLSGKRMTKDGLSPQRATSVVLTEGDIRELQLAKSALRAGLETMLFEAGMDPCEIATTFLAGGLGYYIDPKSAVRIGLLPKELLPTIKTVGNSSLAGAVWCLHDSSGVSTMETLAKQSVTLELNAYPMFSDLFMEHMLFPEEEEK